MYQLAQINVARMRGVTIDDPIMKEFVDNLDRVNELADNSEGFVWRLQDDAGASTSFNPYQDEQIIINISVWESVETLEAYTYKSFHTDFVRRRKEWFQKYGKAHYALWWIGAGNYPSVTECVQRLDYLQAHGASERAFNFKTTFPKPN